MKISSISPQFVYASRTEKKEAVNSKISQNSTNVINNYPKGYVPYFGERLHRTPENFYSQEFNIKNMPYTAKKYLMSDYKLNKYKKPSDLHKEAFANLEKCENVDDVKAMFPDEPLFKDLKTLKELKSPGGYLYDLRYLCDNDNKAVLKSGEDFTLYLVKKVYLEGKDLKEINEDFKKDVREELLDPERYPNGYFQYSTLKTIGVSFPKFSYWKSFQATREDKEYVPYKLDPNAVRKPRVLSPEQREKMSQRMRLRWAEMSPQEREKQKARLIANLGEEEANILFKYLSPIMIIATDKANLSDKLVEFFKKEAGGEECPLDLSNPSKSQHTKLKKFWTENPKTREEFSTAITETIKAFKTANEIGADAIDDLLEDAAKIKEKNEYNAYIRKISSPEYLKQNVLNSINKCNDIYPELYIDAYSSYFVNHRLFKTQFIPMYKKLYVDKNEKCRKPVNDIITKINEDFYKHNKKTVIASNIAIASVINDYIFAPHLYNGSPAGIIQFAQDSQMKDVIKSRKSDIDKIAVIMNRELTQEELNVMTKAVIAYMDRMRFKHNTQNLSEEAEFLLPKVGKAVSKNKDARNKFKAILKDYSPYFIYLAHTSAPDNIKEFFLEHVIDRCIVHYDLKK